MEECYPLPMPRYSLKAESIDTYADLIIFDWQDRLAFTDEVIFNEAWDEEFECYYETDVSGSISDAALVESSLRASEFARHAHGYAKTTHMAHIDTDIPEDPRLRIRLYLGKEQQRGDSLWAIEKLVDERLISKTVADHLRHSLNL